MQHEQRAARRMRNSGGRDGDDEEHVVFYDLDAGSRRQNPLLNQHEGDRARTSATAKLAKGSRSASTAPAKRAQPKHASGILERPNEIFHQQPLFQLDAEDDEHESDDENPFASLLQQRQRKPQPPGDAYEDDAYEDDAFDLVMQTSQTSNSQSSTVTAAAALLQINTQKRPSRESGVPRKSTSPARVTPPRRLRGAALVSPGDSTAGSLQSREGSAKPPAAKRLSVEAADARPSRWAQKTSVSAASGKKGASRRKSMPNALQRKREVQTGEPRRTSLPMGLMASQQEDEAASQSGAPKKRRLADVLMRATLLSQQKSQDERPTQPDAFHESFAGYNDDAIADTEHQMREEKFETQIFSPSKLHHPSALARKKQQKPDAVASKIRGELGEAIARAIRKSTRDLTMLHSHGQTLIEQHQESSGFGAAAGLDRVQDRDHAVVRLRCQRQQQEGSSSELMVYDAAIDALSQGVQAPCEESARVRVAFSSHSAVRLRLKPNALVKIYAPFHFIPIEHAAGASKAVRASKWLLVGTALSEVLA